MPKKSFPVFIGLVQRKYRRNTSAFPRRPREPGLNNSTFQNSPKIAAKAARVNGPIPSILVAMIFHLASSIRVPSGNGSEPSIFLCCVALKLVQLERILYEREMDCIVNRPNRHRIILPLFFRFWVSHLHQIRSRLRTNLNLSSYKAISLKLQRDFDTFQRARISSKILRHLLTKKTFQTWIVGQGIQMI